MFLDVSPENEDRVARFLRAHADTSIYLLSGLKPGHQSNLTSRSFGPFRFMEEHGAVVAVLSLTPAGDLLLETGGRGDLTDAILATCAADRVPITGVVAEWNAASSLWRALCDGPLSPTYEDKQVVHRLDLRNVAPSPRAPAVRRLLPDDFGQWQILNKELIAEFGWPVPPDPETWRPGFAKRSGAGYVWGAFENDDLVSIALLDTVYEHIGQIGNVFTTRPRRQAGFGVAVLKTLIDDAKAVHGLDRLVLFTAESNTAARHIYERLGFRITGEFGLLFGTRTPNVDA